MKRKKTNRILVCLMALILALSGILPSPVFAESQQAQPSTQAYQPDQTSFSDIPADKRGGTFRWGTFASPIDMNPMLGKDSASYDIYSFLTRQLIYQDSSFNFKPDLLVTMPVVSSDGLTYDCELKPNLKWQDGKPLTAYDIKYTVDFTLNPVNNSPRLQNLEMIQEIEILSSTQFRIKLKYVNTNMLYDLLMLKVLPKHIWETVPPGTGKSSDFNKHKAVSCGPYQIKEYSTTGGDIVLERNANYSDGVSYNFDRIIFKIYPSQAMAMLGLEIGAVDFMNLPESDYFRIKSGENCTAYMYDRLVFDTLIYNHTRPYFQDVRVRRAFAHLLDKEAIIRSAYYGLGTPAKASWHSALPVYNKSVQPPEYNVEAAKQLLDSAGWLAGPDGLRSKEGVVFKFKLLTNKGNTMREATSKLIAAQLKAVGITADVEFIEWNDFLTNYVDVGNFDAYIGGFSTGASGDQTVFYHSDKSKAAMNKGSYANADLDRLLDSFRSESDGIKRQVILDNIQSLIVQEQPVSTILFRKQFIGATKALKNINTGSFFSNLDIANYYFDGTASIENPLKISFIDGNVFTSRVGTPIISGSTNAAKDSLVKVTINSVTPIVLQTTVTAEGKWSVTVPQDKSLADGSYNINVEITDTVLGKNVNYQLLKIDTSILFEGEVTLPSGEAAGSMGSIQITRADTFTFVKSIPLDSKGRFYISGLATGSYLIEALPYSDRPYSTSKKIQITTNGTTPDMSLIKLSFSTPQITGNVQTPEGTGIADCYINVRTPNSGYGTGTNQVGGFYIGNLADGTYELRAIPGSNFKRTDLGASKPVTVIITNGFSSLANVNLKLSPVQATGKVVNDANQAVANARLQIYNESDMYVTGSDAKSDGSFSIAGLNDGNYYVEGRLFNSIEYTKSLRQKIEVVNGVATPNTFNLTMLRPQVTGFVKNSDGTPHIGGWVDYGLKNGGSWYGYGYDNQGRFAIGGLSDGVYQLRANPNSNASGLTQSLTATFEISSGKLVGSQDPITLTVQPGLFKVTVLSPQGIPAMRSHVQIRDTNGMHIQGISTNGLGVVYLPNLKTGTYQISAEPDSNSAYAVSKSQTSLVALEAGKPIEIQLQLQSPQVKGLVGMPDGSPAMYSWVEVMGTNGQWVANANANSKGEFYLSGLANGQYKVKANPWYRNTGNVSSSLEKTINILNGTLVESRVELILQAPQVKGTVLNINGTLASGGWIQLINKDTGRWLNGSSVNAQGLFTFSGLSAGNYTIEAMPNNRDAKVFNSAKVDFTVDANGNGPSNLSLQFSAPQVSGVVSTPLGEPVSNIFLEVRDTNGNWITGLSTNQQGEYSLGNLEAGKSYVMVATPRSGSSFSKSVPNTFTVTSGLQTINLSLSNALVEGLVTLPDGTTPAAYTYVSIFKKPSDGGQFVQGISVGQDGKFGIGGLEAGDYEIYAGGGQYGQYRSTTGAALTINVVNDIAVPSSPTLKLLLRNAQVTGKTVLSDNTEVNVSGYVEVYNSSDQVLFSTNMINGQYAINWLSPGQYSLKAFVKPGENVIYGDSDKVSFEIDTNGEVKNPSTTSAGINLTLAQNFVSGNIAATQGITLGKAWIEVGRKVNPADSEITWVMTALVGNTGKYAIAGLADGTYYVQGFYMNGNALMKTNLVTINVVNKTTTNSQLTDMILTSQ